MLIVPYGTEDSSFVDAPVQKLFACNTATRLSNSIAVQLAMQTDSTVYAYSGKSTFRHIVDERNLVERAWDKLFSKDGQAATSRGKSNDAFWERNTDYGFAWEGSRNQPTGSWNSTTYQISPSGTMTQVPSIPDVANNNNNSSSNTLGQRIVSGVSKAINTVSSFVSKVGNFFGNLFK